MNTALKSPAPPLNWIQITVQTRKAANRLRAFNHTLRQQLLTRLQDAGEQTVTELYQHFGLEQSVASQHLAILRRAGLVSTERKGKHIYYSVNREAVLHLLNACLVLNDQNGEYAWKM